MRRPDVDPRSQSLRLRLAAWWNGVRDRAAGRRAASRRARADRPDRPAAAAPRHPVASSPSTRPPRPEKTAASTASAPKATLPISEARRALREAIRRRRAYRRGLGRRPGRRLSARATGWLVAVGVIVALAVASVGLSFSPLLAVRTVTVTGVSDKAQHREAVAALAALRGRPLPTVTADTVRGRLDSCRWVESFAMAAVLPDELSVRITARTPVGSFASGSEYLLVDAAGVAISTSKQAPAGYPVLATSNTDPNAPAFAAAALVSRALDPQLRSSVERIAATSADDVSLTLAGGVNVVWGNASQAEQKAKVLGALRQAMPTATSIDVSSPEAPVVS
jgi:cell division protein FtsQ